MRIPKKLNILTAGDKFSEEWRTSLFEYIGNKDFLHTAVSIYGSADAGILGYETPLSIFLRRKSMSDKRLRESIFGSEAILPALVQYNPLDIFFEEINNELVFTTNTANPLVRYNIHDVGRLWDYSAIKKIINDFGLEKQARSLIDKWQMPFIVKQDRNDVAVTFYALNIYPENIKIGLEDRAISRYVSGQFAAFHKDAHRHSKQELHIAIELAKGISPSQVIAKKIKETLIGSLIRLNIEYRKLYTSIGGQAAPILEIVPFGSSGIYSKATKGFFLKRGKKAKMLQ